jgi:hypothetical protein
VDGDADLMSEELSEVIMSGGFRESAAEGLASLQNCLIRGMMRLVDIFDGEGF